MTNLDHIIPDLRSLAVPLDDLKLDAANARTGHALDRIAASLHRYGQRKPIVVNRSEGNKIEAGNGTWQAAKLLGWTHIAAVFVEDDPMTAVGYGIADNRLGDLSEWDAETLQALVDGLDPELNLPTGFDDDELAAMLAELGAGLGDGGGGEPGDAEPQTNRAEELRQEWGVEPGQLWRLPSRTPGQEHRLICGDCTDGAVVERVMGGERAEMVWTDPPYGVAVGDKNKFLNKIASFRSIAPSNRIEENLEGDTLSEPELTEMLRRAFGNAMSHCLAGGAWYVAAPAGPLHVLFGQILKDAKIWRQTIQWVKNNATFAPLGVDYHWRAEPIFYGWLPGAAHRYYGGRQQDTVWEIDRPVASPEHPTMKPVALVQRAIANSSQTGEVVLDPFCGSGTTIIAAEMTGRCCYAMELKPAYVDVAVKRWEDFTGKKAVLESASGLFPSTTRPENAISQAV